MIGARIFDTGETVAFATANNTEAKSSVQPFDKQKQHDEPTKRTKFSTVYADGKAKRYSTRRSSAWKAVSRRIATFQGSGYMDFSK
tara:strand:- start:22356 stop:22613 length:258 start_codon:yes stop_codon:yes gene_type:complete